MTRVYVSGQFGPVWGRSFCSLFPGGAQDEAAGHASMSGRFPPAPPAAERRKNIAPAARPGLTMNYCSSSRGAAKEELHKCRKFFLRDSTHICAGNILDVTSKREGSCRNGRHTEREGVASSRPIADSVELQGRQQRLDVRHPSPRPMTPARPSNRHRTASARSAAVFPLPGAACPAPTARGSRSARRCAWSPGPA